MVQRQLHRRADELKQFSIFCRLSGTLGIVLTGLVVRAMDRFIGLSFYIGLWFLPLFVILILVGLCAAWFLTANLLWHGKRSGVRLMLALCGLKTAFYAAVLFALTHVRAPVPAWAYVVSLLMVATYGAAVGIVSVNSWGGSAP